MFRHIVLFKLNPEVSSEQQDHALAVLQDLGTHETGIVSWTVRVSEDTRKGIVIVENGLFQDKASYLRFRASPEHMYAGEVMKKLANWLIADYEEI